MVIFVYKITAAFLFAVDNLKIDTTNNEINDLNYNIRMAYNKLSGLQAKKQYANQSIGKEQAWRTGKIYREYIPQPVIAEQKNRILQRPYLGIIKMTQRRQREA